MSNHCPPSDPCPQAKDAADAAVKRVFAILGVDIDNPKEVAEFNNNLRWGASMRRASDRGVLVAVGVTVTGVLSLIGYGAVLFISQAVKGGH